MQATAQQLAERVQATLEGDASIVVHDARSLLRAEPGHLSFLENDKRLRELGLTRASVLVVPANLTLPADFMTGRSVALLRVAEPMRVFLELVTYLRGLVPDLPAGIDPRAVIDPTANLGPGCVVRPLACVGPGTVLGARCVLHPGVVVGPNCVLGDDVVLHPNVVLYEGTRLGHRVTIHSSSVIGADGFGYRFQKGQHNKIPQLGWVEVGDDVEIGAGVTIDCGTVDPTIIGRGTKIDNQVQIAHNCVIGEHNLLVSQVGVGGSCTTGKYVTVAGQVGVADHLKIGDGAVVGAQAGVTRDVPSGARVLGAPAMEELEMKRIVLSLPRLPQMWRDLNQIRRVLGLDEPNTRAA